MTNVLLPKAGNTGGEWPKEKGIVTGLLNLGMLVTYLNGSNNNNAIREQEIQGKAKLDNKLLICESHFTQVYIVIDTLLL